MKLNQVALITYTIRDFIKTPEDFRESMRKLAAIGYQAVQISGMSHDVLPPEEIAAICAENGLTICATHEPSDMILNEPEKIIARLKALGCRYTAYPFPTGYDLSQEKDLATLIQKLDAAGAAFREAGLVLTYHNHANEFVRCGGEIALRRIYNETDPQNLQGELDTYWVQLGGGNPAAWCESLPGRLPLLHLKDVKIHEVNKPIMAEIGQGNLDFKPIIKAAEQAGCEWFIVEQDVCPGDPFDSLKLSFDYISANLVD